MVELICVDNWTFPDTVVVLCDGIQPRFLPSTIYNVTVTDLYLVLKGFYLYHSRILKEENFPLPKNDQSIC